jgi:hypothetical protein
MEAPPNAQKQITTTDAPQWLPPISEQPAALAGRFAYMPSMLGRVRDSRGRPKNAPAGSQDRGTDRAGTAFDISQCGVIAAIAPYELVRDLVQSDQGR